MSTLYDLFIIDFRMYRKFANGLPMYHLIICKALINNDKMLIFVDKIKTLLKSYLTGSFN